MHAIRWTSLSFDRQDERYTKIMVEMVGCRLLEDERDLKSKECRKRPVLLGSKGGGGTLKSTVG